MKTILIILALTLSTNLLAQTGKCSVTCEIRNGAHATADGYETLTSQQCMQKARLKMTPTKQAIESCKFGMGKLDYTCKAYMNHNLIGGTIKQYARCISVNSGPINHSSN